MPSNLERLSAVARSAFPRFNKKLRANPSLTRTTSPIWPSLATRSSKMTSISVLLLRLRIGGWCERYQSRGREGRRPPLQVTAANRKDPGGNPADSDHTSRAPKHRVGNPEDGDHQYGPAKPPHDRIGAAEPQRAALQRQRQCMQHRKTGER